MTRPSPPLPPLQTTEELLMLTTPPPPAPALPSEPGELKGVGAPPALKKLAPPAPLRPLPTVRINDAVPALPLLLIMFPFVAKPPKPDPNRYDKPVFSGVLVVVEPFPPDACA